MEKHNRSVTNSSAGIHELSSLGGSFGEERYFIIQLAQFILLSQSVVSSHYTLFKTFPL